MWGSRLATMCLQVVFENGGRLSYHAGECKDYVHLLDGANLDAKMCDNPIANSPTYIAETGNLDLHFHTSPVVKRDGFSLTITILGKCCHSLPGHMS